MLSAHLIPFSLLWLWGLFIPSEHTRDQLSFHPQVTQTWKVRQEDKKYTHKPLLVQTCQRASMVL